MIAVKKTLEDFEDHLAKIAPHPFLLGNFDYVKIVDVIERLAPMIYHERLGAWEKVKAEKAKELTAFQFSQSDPSPEELDRFAKVDNELEKIKSLKPHTPAQHSAYLISFLLRLHKDGPSHLTPEYADKPSELDTVLLDILEHLDARYLNEYK